MKLFEVRRAMVFSAAACVGGMLPGCATPSQAQASVALLRLSPASLGGTLSLQQQLWVSAQGQEHRFDAVLEVDADALRLAVLNHGQTVARLEWDGKDLTASKVAWWPAAVSGERVLSDLQLMLWPLAEIAAALPPGWTVEQSEPQLRTLRDGPELVATVRYLKPNLAELAQLRQAYRIRVESRPFGPAP